jgi:hypothetical protein
MTFARTVIATTGLAAVLTLAAATPSAQAQERTPSPEDASAFIIAPADGATVTSPVTVYFGLAGMGVAPAGVEWDNTGHHHLLINLDEVVSYDEPIPADDNHIHFGGGQTQTTIELEPGEHTLQLLLADWQHLPHDPPVMSPSINITVE